MGKGSEDIVERGRATRFTNGGKAAVEAGKKSGQRRRELRSMRQIMKLLAATPLKPGKVCDLAKIKSLQAVSGKDDDDLNLTAQDIIALNILHGAIEGDPESRRLFLDLSGAMLPESVGENAAPAVRIICDIPRPEKEEKTEEQEIGKK